MLFYFIILSFLCLFILIFIILCYFINYLQIKINQNNLNNLKTRNINIFLFIIIFSLFISFILILFLPFDIENNNGNIKCDQNNQENNCGYINFRIIWIVLFWFVYILLLVIFLYLSFFNWFEENITSSIKSRSSYLLALYWFLPILLITIFIIVLSYFNNSIVHLPLEHHTLSISSSILLTNFTNNTISSYLVINENDLLSSYPISTVNSYVQYKIDFSLFFITFLGWISWFPFIFLLSIGFITVPFHLFCYYYYSSGILNWNSTFLTSSLNDHFNFNLNYRIETILRISKAFQEKRRDFRRSGTNDSDKIYRNIRDKLLIERFENIVRYSLRQVNYFMVSKYF